MTSTTVMDGTDPRVIAAIGEPMANVYQEWLAGAFGFRSRAGTGVFEFEAAAARVQAASIPEPAVRERS